MRRIAAVAAGDRRWAVSGHSHAGSWIARVIARRAPRDRIGKSGPPPDNALMDSFRAVLPVGILYILVADRRPPDSARNNPTGTHASAPALPRPPPPSPPPFAAPQRSGACRTSDRRRGHCRYVYKSITTESAAEARKPVRRALARHLL
jgi:hypothetical protein